MGQTNITDFERSVLEDLFGHGAIEVLWNQDSRSARILGVREARGPWVVKMPGWGTLAVLNQEERSAQVSLMNRATMAFHSRLTKLGVTLPRHYEIKELRGFPIHLSSDHGEDCARIVQRSPSELSSTIEKIVRIITGVFASGDRQVGIDARLSNFSLSENGEAAVYIDIFPPLINFDGQYLVHFPNPTAPEEVAIEIERKFTPFGILRRLRFDLLAVNPAWGEQFSDALRAVDDQPLRSELNDRFGALPDQRVLQMSEMERRRLLNRLPPGDADTRREIAARVIPVGALRSEVMLQVFAATSFVGVSENERHARLERFGAIIDPFL